MPRKEVSIGKKPSGTRSTKKNIDDWVEEKPPAQTKKTSTPQKSKPAVKMKRLTIDVSEELHKAIKMKAVQEGVAMADMLRSLLEDNYL